MSSLCRPLNPRSKHKRTCSLTENVCPSNILRPRTRDRRAVRTGATKFRKEGIRITSKAWIFSAVLQHPSRKMKLCFSALHVGVWWGYDILVTRSLTIVLARLLSLHGRGFIAPTTGTCSPLAAMSRNGINCSRRSFIRVPVGGRIPQRRSHRRHQVLSPWLISASVNADKISVRTFSNWW